MSALVQRHGGGSPVAAVVPADLSSYRLLAWTAVARLASPVATASATAVDVTGLAFALGANETWSFEFRLMTQSSAGLGHRWALDVPAGCTVVASARGSRGSAVSIIADDITADDTLTGTFGTGTYATGGWVDLYGTVANGSTAGTVQLRFATATGLDTATVKAGSFLNALRHS